MAVNDPAPNSQKFGPYPVFSYPARVEIIDITDKDIEDDSIRSVMVKFDGTYATYAKLIHPDDLPEMERGLNASRESHSEYDAEYRVVWPDGSIHWVASRGRFCARQARRTLQPGSTSR